MSTPRPVLIQHLMSKLLLAAAPIETLIKAIRLSNRGGAGGPEDVVNSSYTSTSVEKNTTLRRGGGRVGGGILCRHRWWPADSARITF